MLLYGAGLRIGEALGLTGAVLPLGETMRVTGKRAAKRIGPVRPGKQPAIMEMDSDGKGGGVPRLVKRAARHRPVGLCGCRSGHAGTR